MPARRVAILQPSYLPWLGYLDQVDAADVFVFYDDVQFDPGGWRNRNRIKTNHGVKWLTVPVTHSRSSGVDLPNLRDLRAADSPWRRKHLGAVAQAYARSPHVKELVRALQDLLDAQDSILVDLTVNSTHLCMELLGVSTPTLLASELGITGGKTTRLVEICRHLGATHYISGAAARAYLEVDRFSEAGIAVEFQDYNHPVYPQEHGPFEPYLSTIDLIANVGQAALEVLRSGRRYVPG